MDPCPSASRLKYGRRRKFIVNTVLPMIRKVSKLTVNISKSSSPGCYCRLHILKAEYARVLRRRDGEKGFRERIFLYSRHNLAYAVSRSTPSLQTFGFRPPKIPGKTETQKHPHSKSLQGTDGFSARLREKWLGIDQSRWDRLIKTNSIIKGIYNIIISFIEPLRNRRQTHL